MKTPFARKFATTPETNIAGESGGKKKMNSTQENTGAREDAGKSTTEPQSDNKDRVNGDGVTDEEVNEQADKGQAQIEKRKKRLQNIFDEHEPYVTRFFQSRGVIGRHETYLDLADTEQGFDMLVKKSEELIKHFESMGDEDFFGNPEKLLIPGSYEIAYQDVASKLFSRMAESGEFFVRGTEVVAIGGDCSFDPITDQSLRTIGPKLFRKGAYKINIKVENDKAVMTQKKGNMSKDLCASILATPDKFPLPKISTILACPVLYENEDGGVTLAREGYTPNVAGGVFVSGGDSISPKSINIATELIAGLFLDFDFAAEADRTRAIAMVITVALVQGGFLSDRIPVDYAEANESQSGKGYRHDLVVAIYNENAILVTQRTGGTGSFDEAFDGALLKGRTFIRLDNLRGKLESQSLEGFITTPVGGQYRARSFREVGYIEAGRNIIQASSNGARGTHDIANRSCIIRIRKRPDGYPFSKFEEGDMLSHVRSNQGKFLGAVHAIVKEWVNQGKKKTDESRHDFKEWVGILDWIMKNIFKRSDLMDGHRGIQARTRSRRLAGLGTRTGPCGKAR
jgi:hypothetical protein